MRTISPFEFVRRFKQGVVAHESRVVWFLGAGCSVSSGVEDAATLTMRWLSELKYLETGSTDDVEEWGESRFLSFDRTDPAAAYGDVHDALFYTEQDQQREQERLSTEGQPGFAYATLAQLLTHEKWGERCNTVITTNFDDLAADALYFYSQRKPQVLTHESFDRHVQISSSRPTIMKLYGDAHLGAEYLDGNRRLLRTDVKDRLRAQLTEATLVFVGYGGRDDCILDLLEGLPNGAPSGGIFWVNDKAPGRSLSGWLEERSGIWVQNDDFDTLMYRVNREFELGHPRIERFDQILQKYDDQYRAVAAQQRKLDADAETEAPAPPPLPGADDAAAETSEAPEPVVDAPDDTVAASSAAPAAALSGAAANGADRPAVTPERVDAKIELVDLAVDFDGDFSADDIDPGSVSESEDGVGLGVASEDVLELSDVAAHHDDEAQDASGEEPAGSRARIDALIAAAVKAMATEDDGKGEPPVVDISASADGDGAVAVDAPAEDTAEAPPPAAALDPQPMPDKPRAAPVLSPDAEDIALDPPPSDPAALIPPRRLLRREEAVALDAQFRAAIADNPRDASLLARYAQFLSVGRRDHDGAEHHFNRAIDADPQNEEALRLFAAFLSDIRRDDDRAEDCYRLAIRANFENPETMCAYAEFLWRARGDFETAGECFQVAVDAAPRDATALMRFARFLRNVQRNDDAAFALLKLASASAGDDPKPMVALAEFLAARDKDLEKAEATFERALSIAPDSAETRVAAARFHARFKQDMTAAQGHFEHALKADPGSVEALLAYAEFVREKTGDVERAESLLRKAMDRDPGDAMAVLAFARFQDEALADDEAADDSYRKAITLDPGNATILGWYGRFLQYSRKKPDAAEDRFRKAISLAPRNPLALRSYGWFLALERSSGEDAERYLRRAVSAAPADADALGDLAYFLSKRAERRDEADQMFRRALAIDPDNRQTLRRYARFTSDGKGDPDTAEKLFRQVLDGTPEDARALGGAAHAMFVQGRRQEGLSLLERAFNSAMGDEPKRRSSDLLLELWFYRYAFDHEAGRDAIKAAVWLVKDGARATRGDLNAIVVRALADGHPEPDLLRELAHVARGEAGPERLDRFNVA